MTNPQQIATRDASALDDLESFLTVALLARCLGCAPPTLEPDDIEQLIARVASLMRKAASAASGTSRVRSNALPRHKLRAVAAYVGANLESPLRVADLASVACVSPYHFSRQFRLATGLAPHQYVLLSRMQRAAQILATTQTAVGEVAVEVGCADQSHFTNMFRRVFGCTPRRFRQYVRDDVAVSRAPAAAGSPSPARRSADAPESQQEWPSPAQASQLRLPGAFIFYSTGDPPHAPE